MNTATKPTDTDKMPGKELTARTGVSLVQKFAHRYSIEANKLLDILKATAFKQREGGDQISNEQMAALLVVADQYGLNPFTKQIFAFPDKQNGIVPVVGVDGWAQIANSNTAFNGMSFVNSPDMVMADDDCKECPSWMEVTIYRKDQEHPIIIREYLDEVYRPAFVRKDYKVKGPWQSHTKRMLRHKTMIQGLRVAFGLSGIYDEDEAGRIIEGEIVTANDFQSKETKALNEGIAGVKKITTTDYPADAAEPTDKIPPKDFDIEQPGKEQSFTVVDVTAKITTINGLVKKAKRPADWEKIGEILDETVDMANSIDIPEGTTADLEGLAELVSKHLEG